MVPEMFFFMLVAPSYGLIIWILPCGSYGSRNIMDMKWLNCPLAWRVGGKGQTVEKQIVVRSGSDSVTNQSVGVDKPEGISHGKLDSIPRDSCMGRFMLPCSSDFLRKYKLENDHVQISFTWRYHSRVDIIHVQ